MIFKMTQRKVFNCLMEPNILINKTTKPEPESSCGATPKPEDTNLVAATLVALETGDLNPLIKEELKYTIQSRRVAEGKEELRVHFDINPTYTLTPEEEEKAARRKEQNRLAARRFRQRQREGKAVHNKRIRGLESGNTRLRMEIQRLRQEREQLRAELHAHLLVCPRINGIT